MATKARRKPTKKTKAPLARVTQPDDTIGKTGAGWEQARLEYALYEWGLLGDYKDQLYVNHHTALTFSAVWACVRYISQSVASLGWHVFEGVPGRPGKERVYDDVSWLLDTQSSPEMDAFNFRQVLLKDALTWGNGYAEIDRDGFGRPRWLWYLAPDRVDLKRDDTGRLYYEIDNGPGESASVIRPENMFHVKGLGPDGLVGYSVIAMARLSIKLGLQTEKYGDQFFKRGPMPGGVLNMPGNVKKEERDSTQKSFQNAYGGTRNAGNVIVLSGGMEFTPLSMPNEDAQFLESRKFQVTEICRWYGVPPHKVADLERATFSNIEHMSIEAVQDCFLPWCRRLETEADLKLFGRVNRGRKWTRLNLNTLLRGDSATQTANLVSQVNTGLVTPDEAREHLDYNPYPDGLGEKPIVQGAMMPLETALDPPEPPQPAVGPAQPPADEEPEPAVAAQAKAMPAQLMATFGELLADAYGRLLRVEADKAKRAENKGELSRHVSYYDTDGMQHIADTIEPILAALLLACDRPTDSAERFAHIFAHDHAFQSVEDIKAGTWSKSWANGRASEQAQKNLRELWESLGGRS